MNLVQARDAIVTQMATWVTTPIFYDNAIDIDIDKQPDAFVQCIIRWDTSKQANIDANPFRRMFGTLIVRLFVRESTGSRVALGYIDTLTALFEFKNLGAVHMQAPAPGYEQTKNGWFSIDLRTPFFLDSNA